MLKRLSITLLILAVSSPVLFADDEKPIQAEAVELGRPVDFNRDIYPILEANCIACHNKAINESDLILEDTAGLMKGGASGPIVVPGKPAESMLLSVVARTDEPFMPPLPNEVEAKALTPKQVGLIKLWIQEGAKAGMGGAGRTVNWRPIPSHLKSIYAVSLSPWARYAAAGRTNRIAIYDLVTGVQTSQLTDPNLLPIQQDGQPMYGPGSAHRDFVHALAFNPDGDLLASGGYRNVKLWKRSPHVKQHEFDSGHATTALAVSADQTWVAVAAADNNIRLWNVKDGSAGKTLNGHTDRITGIAFSPDGTKLASSSADKTVRLWNLADGAQVASVEAPSALNDVAVNNDATILLTAGEDNIIRKWTVAVDDAKAVTLTAAGELKGHGQPVTSLAIVTPAGTHIVSGAKDNTARIWEIASGKNTRSLNHGEPVNDVAVRADGQRIASAGQNGTAKVWQFADGKLLSTIRGDMALARVVVTQTENKTVSDQLVAEADRKFKESEKNVKDREEAAKKATEAKTNADKALEDPTKKDTEAKTALDTAKKELEAAKKELDEANKALVAANNNHAAAVKAQEVAGKELEAANKALTDANNNQTAAKKELDAANGELDAANKTLDGATKELDGATKAQQAANAELEAAKKELADKADDEALKKKVADAEKKAADAATKVNDSKKKSDAAKTTADAAKKKADAAKVKADDTQKKAAEAKTKADAADTKTAEAKKKTDEAKKAADAAKKNAEGPAKQKVDAAQKKSDESQKKADEAAANLKKAQDAQAAAQRALELANKSVEKAKAQFGTHTKEKEAAVAHQTAKNGELEAGKKQEAESNKPVRSVAFAPDGKRLAVGDEGNRLQIWDAESGRALETLSGHASPVALLAFAGDGLLLAAGSENVATAWGLKSEWTLAGQLGPKADAPLDLSSSPFIDRVLCLAFSNDGRLLVTGGGDPSRSGELIIWDVEKRSVVREIKDAHSDTVFGVEFSRDDKYLLSGAADKFVKIHDVATGNHVRSFEGHTHHVMDVAWQAHGFTMGSAGADNAVKIWNVETGEQRRTIAGHSKQVTSIQFIGVTENLVTAAGDKIVRHHTASNGRRNRDFGGSSDYVYSAAVARDESVVVAGGEDGVLRVWNAKDAKSLFTFEPPAPPDEKQASAAR